MKATDARWQVAQAAPRAPLCASAWQVAHEAESFRKERVLWHDSHLPARGACFPSSGKPASFACSNPFVSNGRSSASRPACSAWQAAHSFVTSRWTPFFAAILDATSR